MLLEEANLTDQQRSYVQHIFEAGKSLLELANKLTTAKKLTASPALSEEQIIKLIEIIQTRNNDKKLSNPVNS